MFDFDYFFFFFFQAEDGIRDYKVTGVQTCALPISGGATDEAVRLMREAAALEDRMPAEFGPPADVKPAHELFGEMLLEAGRAAEAQREFARALALAPKRALSLLGLGRAAAAAGDRATAAQAYREVREIWHRADPGLPGLAEASRSVGAP